MSRPFLLFGASGALLLLLGWVVLGSPDQNAQEPSRTAVRELELPEPEGVRVEYFRLDLASAARGGLPAGVVRWVSSPAQGGGESATHLECEIHFFDVDTRVFHSELLRPEERKLVWREVRDHSGRTVLLDWTAEGTLRLTETSRGEVHRRELDASSGALMPLFIVENVRSGAELDGAFPVFHPLSGDFEDLWFEVLDGGDVLEADGAASSGPVRELEARRADGSLSARYRFEGKALVSFQWQEGGAFARPITEEKYRYWAGYRDAESDH